jgi:GT2 family glycosyltransferase
VQPDYLEKLFDQFLADEKVQLGAVSGVYLDPRRSDDEQIAPPGFEQNVDYAGKIDHNVPWPYVCRYPPGTKTRSVEHLYSSFMYRVDVAMAIGGYCKLFSQIGHREESDFSYRFFLAGYKLLIHPEAVGYHFSAPASGIRAMDIQEKESLANTDHKIYSKRLARWKERVIEKKEKEEQRVKELATEAQKAAPVPNPTNGNGKVACLLNGGSDIEVICEAVERFAENCDALYVTCEAAGANDLQERIEAAGKGKVKRVGTTPMAAAVVFAEAMTNPEFEYVMTANDNMRFYSDPTTLLSPDYDEYVFEVYSTYQRGHVNGETFTPSSNAPVLIGPECRNMCLISRRGTEKTDLERTLYSDVMVIDDRRLPRNSTNLGASALGNPLLAIDEMGTSSWTKFCIFQHPEGEINPPRAGSIEADVGPVVSIIIPTPGRIMHLKRCLDSIYSLTTTPFEIIVVDNGSTDGTKELLEQEKKVRGNLRILRQPTNLGFQKGVNIGVNQARGKYVLIFNDDAWVSQPEPTGDWLSNLIEEIEKDPKNGIVGPHKGESPALKKEILYFWCVLFRRTTWDEIGPLDDITFINYGGDDDYCERLRLAGYKLAHREVRLQHLMTLVPDEEKAPALAESRLKLCKKYGIEVTV